MCPREGSFWPWGMASRGHVLQTCGCHLTLVSHQTPFWVSGAGWAPQVGPVPSAGRWAGPGCAWLHSSGCTWASALHLYPVRAPLPAAGSPVRAQRGEPLSRTQQARPSTIVCMGECPSLALTAPSPAATRPAPSCAGSGAHRESQMQLSSWVSAPRTKQRVPPSQARQPLPLAGPVKPRPGRGDVWSQESVTHKHVLGPR